MTLPVEDLGVVRMRAKSPGTIDPQATVFFRGLPPSSVNKSNPSSDGQSSGHAEVVNYSEGKPWSDTTEVDVGA